MAALDTPLTIYHCMIIDRRIRNNSHQASAYVAAGSQKEAAELIGVTPTTMQQDGGEAGGVAICKFLNEHPREVYIQTQRQEWFTKLDDYADRSKHVHVPVNDPETYGYETRHPAFGQVSLVRTQGSSPLFQVDYDTGHSIRLQIQTANLNRQSGHDHVFGNKSIVEIALSEVQFARLVAGVGGGGVPCTLLHYRDPMSGEFLQPHLPEKHVVDVDIHKAEIEKRARLALEAVTEATTLLRQILEPGSVKKADLARVLELLDTGTRQGISNLSYAVQVAQETVERATESGKAEVDAHVEFSMARLGERALGARLQQALEAGVDIGALGRNVAALLEDRREPEESA